MDVDPLTDQAEQGDSQGSGKSDSMAAEPRPSGVIPPDFSWFETLPKDQKDDTANGKSA